MAKCRATTDPGGCTGQGEGPHGDAAAERRRQSPGHRGRSPSGKSQRQGENPAFMLSDGLAPVPGKLVAKIVHGEFVDMAELLHDNIEALRRCSGADTTSNRQSAKSARQEVPDILSWIQCFGVYAAVGGQ